jgi:hypothetical protein
MPRAMLWANLRTDAPCASPATFEVETVAPGRSSQACWEGHQSVKGLPGVSRMKRAPIRKTEPTRMVGYQSPAKMFPLLSANAEAIKGVTPPNQPVPKL